MIRTQSEAKAFLASFEKTHPGAFALARAVSLAARVEPELLRTARLRLFRQFSAGDEADFWFSECVEAEGGLWALLAPAVAEELRADLAARGKPGDARKARDLIVELHANAAPLVQLEETIHWLSLGGPRRRNEVDAALRPVLQAVRQPDDAGVAQWAAYTIPRLSGWVRDLSIAWAIRIVAEQRLGGTVSVDPRGSAIPAEAAAILRDLLPMTEVWVRLTAENVEISRERLLGGHPITVPATEPIALTIRDSEDTRPVELHGALQRVPARGSVTIGTMTGTSWSLRPTETKERTQVTFRFVGGVFESPLDPRPRGEVHVAFERPDDYRFRKRWYESQIVIFVPDGEDDMAVLAEMQRTAFGLHPFLSGKQPGDFATTIDVDGALVGIVSLGALNSRVGRLDRDRLALLCGGSPEEWIGRHHASVLVTSDIILVLEPESIESLGFSFVVHSSTGTRNVDGALPIISIAFPFVGELNIGPDATLLVDQDEMITKSTLPVRLRPLSVDSSEPEQWVLIAGSSYKISTSVEEIARAVGQQLAREGIGLSTGGWRGVDEIVSLSYAEALQGRGAAAVSRSMRHFLGTIQPRAEVAGERLLYADDESAVLESLRRADAVLLLGGYGGTAWIAEEARKLGKPIVGIPQTGGAAQRIAAMGLSEIWWEARDPAVIAASAVGALRRVMSRPSASPVHPPIVEGVQYGKIRKRQAAKRKAASSKKAVRKVILKPVSKRTVKRAAEKAVKKPIAKTAGPKMKVVKKAASKASWWDRLLGSDAMPVAKRSSASKKSSRSASRKRSRLK